MNGIKTALAWLLLSVCMADIVHFSENTSLRDGWRAFFTSSPQNAAAKDNNPSLSLSELAQLPENMTALKSSLKNLSSSLSLLKDIDEEMQKTVDTTGRLNALLVDEEKLLGQAVVYLKPLAFASRTTNALTAKSTEQTRRMENILHDSFSTSSDILKETQQLSSQAKTMRDSMKNTLVSMQKVKDKLPKNLPK